jgi:hypothetical protein
MTQQLIIVGTPNSREGDSLFAAFTKINENFSVIYTALGLDSDTTLNLGDFEFTNSIMTNTNSSTIIVGKASTDTVVVGDTSQTTTIESQIEIATTGIVIAKRLIETNDDGITTATDNLRSAVELNNAKASIGRYLNPEGDTNTVYSQFTTSGGAIIECVAEGLPGYETYGRVHAGADDVVISANNGGFQGAWSFGGNGILTDSKGSFTKTINTGIAPRQASAVVWTSTLNSISGAKLTIQVEAEEGSGLILSNDPDTQVCEAIIATKGWDTTSQPVISVYGVTHTSVAPLMTFTVERNPTTGLIEIVGTRTETSRLLYSPNLRIYSVETGTLE